ncbi:MAG TPA: tetratricopeptide repeat protein [Acidobacteriota bacterium]|nr:tetratricopeptide repeat protein [Acidobacteriota bacterium]
MAESKLTNWIFALVVIALAGVALVSMYVNMDRPVVQDVAAPDPESVSVPQNHPPLDAANRLAEVEKLSAADPQNAEYKTQIGNTYYDLGQYQKAVDAYQASLKLRPEDPAVETDLANCFHFLGQEDQALELLNKVLQHRPDYPQALFNKGLVLIDGKHDAAGGIAAWEYLLKSNPGYPRRAEVEEKIRALRSSGK